MVRRGSILDTMDLTTIATSLDDRVFTITLDRPDRLNAFTVPMQRELCAVLDEVDANPDVRVVVVTGRGRGFCAGADLAGGGDSFDVGAGSQATGGGTGPHRDEGGLLTLRILQCTKPVIAAINGPAVGVGATMTLPMDIRLASESARFGFVFARRGLVPEACSSWFLPRVVGINTALEWTITGRVFDAQEALDRGLVRSIHGADDLLPAAYELAAEIASTTSAVSVAMTRQMLWRMLGEWHPMAAHRVDSPAIASLGRSADVREGVMSFLDKRAPPFTDQVPADLPPVWPWFEEPDF
jgi:enoyl-CoA hydratase/carnithine racemase